MELKDLATQIDRCSQCNFCQAVCPVFREDLVESSVARGRLNLIQAAVLDKAVPLTERARELIHRCLLCTNCVQGCPTGVPVDDIVIAARHELTRGKGPAWPLGIVFRRMLKRGTEASAAVRTVSWLRRFNLVPGRLPPLADPPFLQRTAAGGRVVGARARVAYFVGCGTNYLFPDTGTAVCQTLADNGVEVVIPEGQVCCGMPALVHGDLEAAAQAIRANAAVLAALDVDAVVTDCTSCGFMLSKKADTVLDPDDPVRPQVLAVAAKTVEITEFLVGLPLAAPERSGFLKVTYHVPCHRSWSPGLVAAPANLIARLGGVELAPLAEPERCCGAGGTFFLSHTELSEKIRKRKLADVLRTGAQKVVTQCPACRYYLSEGLADHGVTVVHPVALAVGWPPD